MEHVSKFVNAFVDISLTFLIVQLIHFYLMLHFLVYDQNLSFLQN